MITLGDIAATFGLALHGDASLHIEGLCGVTDNLPGRLSFVTSGKHARLAATSSIPAFVVTPGARIEGKSCLEHAAPEYAIARIATLFERSSFTQSNLIHPSAVIHPSASLGANVQIGPFVAIGAEAVIGEGSVLHAGAVVMDRAVLGAHCTLYPHAVVREDCVLGQRVILQPGASIGGDGFGFVTHKGEHVKIPQLGNVVLEDDVEVGANTTIDRGRFTETRVGRGTKVDNLVMLGHNVKTGEHCLLVSQVGISGSTKLGDRVTLAGQVGVAGHLNIGDDITVLGQSGITKSLRNPGLYAGMPVRPVDSWRRAMAWLYAESGKAAKPDDDEDAPD